MSQLRIELKYGPSGERVIRHLKRVSKPGRRVYSKAKDLRPVLNGLGITIISTSRGVISDREARQRNSQHDVRSNGTCGDPRAVPSLIVDAIGIEFARHALDGSDPRNVLAGGGTEFLEPSGRGQHATLERADRRDADVTRPVGGTPKQSATGLDQG